MEIMETLEGRQLLSASLVGQIASGKLTKAVDLPANTPPAVGEALANAKGGKVISTLAHIQNPAGNGNIVSLLAKLRLPDASLPGGGGDDTDDDGDDTGTDDGDDTGTGGDDTGTGGGVGDIGGGDILS